MADVWPFAGTRYAHEDDSFSLADVIAPPYDDITPDQQRELHDRHQFNIVRLVDGFATASDDDMNNRYLRAAECYRGWKGQAVLVDEQRKCFYVYEHTYTVPGTKEQKTRLGFLALVKLQDFRSGKVRAAKLTHESPKLDRLRLLRAIEVNLSPLHMLYHDPEDEVPKVLRELTDKKEPEEDFTDSKGDRHRLWLMHKKDPILRIHEAMKPKRLYIADGHHRYETALKYRDLKREETGRRDGRQPYDFVLMFLQRAEDEAIETYAEHLVLARELGADVDMDIVLEDLGEYFDVKPFKVDMKDFDKAAASVRDHLKPPAKKGKSAAAHSTRFVMTLPNGRSWSLSLKADVDYDEMIDDEIMSTEFKAVDPVLLHRFVISRGWIGNPEVEVQEDDVYFRRDITEALDLIKRRKGCVAFFMNPLPKETVLEVAERGELLPHNSVSFAPKIPAGLVLRDLNVGFG